MPLVEAVQRSEEWYSARNGRITASLAAACLGRDPYRGPLAAFNQITGITKQREANRDQQWGIEFEASALACYEIETGHLYTPTGLWVHDTYDWLGASPDGLVGSDGLVEAKCPSIVPPDPPDHHLIQMAVQMAVLNRSWCDYIAWNQNEHIIRRVNRDMDAEAELIRLLAEFYEQHIKPMKPPSRTRKKPVPESV